MNTTLLKEQITFEEFMKISEKLDIRIGLITNAERIPKSNGLKLTVNFGESIGVKTAFTNLGKILEPERFINLSCPFIMNLVSSEIKGVTSEVMIMVGETTIGDGVAIELNNYSIGSTLL